MNPSLELRNVALRVPDLARSLDFYVAQLGFVPLKQDGTSAQLGVSIDAPAILSLVEDRTAVPPSPAAAGLFHAALLFPTREALGGWLRFAAGNGVEFDGFSDHGVSEAIYFSDPDGNGLEFYADRPRQAWPVTSSGIEMVTKPLDLESLINPGQLSTPPLGGAHWGHLHLRVTDLDRSEAFYTGALGLAVTQRNYPGARFLAADGYHHHLGTNTWGRPHLPQKADAAGLVQFTFARRGLASAAEVRDPDGLSVRIEPL